MFTCAYIDIPFNLTLGALLEYLVSSLFHKEILYVGKAVRICCGPATVLGLTLMPGE